MPYVVGGEVQNNRSWMRSSIVTDTFWSFINFIVLFFQTMFQPDLSKQGRGYQSSYSTKPRGGPDGPGPRRPMGGFRRNTGPSAPPMAGGG
uniref:Selenoprotein K n=1 Tax=Phallusia mammillata TaxID=59560 RepID=A0A6F9DSK9_9ASCI|nr:selenoprotein K [Phallusia mammillata]